MRDFGFDAAPDTEPRSPDREPKVIDLWSEPLPIPGLLDFDLDASLRADRVVGRRGFEVEDLSFRGSFLDGRARVGDLGMTWDGGRVYATAEVDGHQSPPAGSLRAWVDGAMLRRFLAQFTRVDVGKGVVDARIDLRSRGETANDMLAGLDGKVVLYGRDGTLAGRYSRALQLEIVPRGQKDPELGDYERINCFIADLVAKKGRVELRSVLFDTPEQQVLASGHVDFAARRLNVLLAPALKETIPGSVTAAIRIRGSLDDPIVSPEPLATAGLVTQALVERALQPVRRWLPEVGGAIDGARRGTNQAIGASGLPVRSQLWVPGVDITCERFLALENVASALAAEPASPDAGL